jgi:hypothetical protein
VASRRPARRSVIRRPASGSDGEEARVTRVAVRIEPLLIENRPCTNGLCRPRAELGRARRFSSLVAAPGHGGLSRKCPEGGRHLALGGQAASMGSRVTLWPSRSSWRTSWRW